MWVENADDGITKKEIVMSNEFVEGDTVYFYVRPGMIVQSVVEFISPKSGWHRLANQNVCYKSGSLHKTREEAEAELSPDAKRLIGCITEAEAIWNYYGLRGVEKENILTIAFKLYDTE